MVFLFVYRLYEVAPHNDCLGTLIHLVGFVRYRAGFTVLRFTI